MLAIFATLFGSAASLGLGALQIGSGHRVQRLGRQCRQDAARGHHRVLTIAFIASAVSGIAKGIQWLSNINMVLALVLALFVFVAGPTLLILNLLPTALGDYASQMTGMASRTAASGDDEMKSWLASWTIFYWAWWVSWTPFVGMFIARISRGRTIRQFVTGVLIVPSLVSLVWFAVFGGTAIDVQRKTGDLVGKAGAVEPNSALFGMLDHLPLASISTVLVMVLVGIFFVSGADAASIVMGTLSEKGSIEPSKADRHLLGHRHGRCRGDHARDRWQGRLRGAHRAAADHDRRCGPVRAGHGGDVPRALQGPADRPGDRPAPPGRRARGARPSSRAPRSRRRLRAGRRAGDGDSKV